MVHAYRGACGYTPLTRDIFHSTGLQRQQSCQFRFRRRRYDSRRQLLSRAQVQTSCRFRLSNPRFAILSFSASFSVPGQLQGAQHWPEAQCLEDIYEQLAARLCDTAEQKTPPQK